LLFLHLFVSGWGFEGLFIFLLDLGDFSCDFDRFDDVLLRSLGDFLFGSRLGLGFLSVVLPLLLLFKLLLELTLKSSLFSQLLFLDGLFSPHCAELFLFFSLSGNAVVVSFPC